MPIEVMDMAKMAREHGKRKVIFNTNRFHAWLHVYPKPGDADDMHCHNADQTFYVIEGECTMHFPDGGKAVHDAGHGRDDHRRIVLSIGKHRHRPDGADGQPLRTVGSDPAYQLRAAQGYQNLSREEMESIRHPATCAFPVDAHSKKETHGAKRTGCR